MGTSDQVMRVMETLFKTCVLWLGKVLSVMKVIGRLDRKLMRKMQSPITTTWQPTTHQAEAPSNR